MMNNASDRIARAPLPLIRKTLIRFELTEELTNADASATADILTQYGAGADHGITEGITVLNYETSSTGVYRWEGVSGAVGLAEWHQGNEFVIKDLECP
jgi:hypothetical protein